MKVLSLKFETGTSRIRSMNHDFRFNMKKAVVISRLLLSDSVLNTV
jgi:hypothetical protein